MQGPVELSGGMSSVLDLRSPHLHDATASVEVPSVQVRGELRLRVFRFGQLALIHERGLADTYHALDPAQPPVREGSATSVGAAVRYTVHFADTPAFTIGLGIEGLVWSLPYVRDKSCLAICNPDHYPRLEEGTATTMVSAFSLIPAYRRGRWTFYAGLYAAPHPTVHREVTQTAATGYDLGVDPGDMNVLAHAGVELSIRQLSVLVQIQDDLSVAPASYAPSFGLAIAGRMPGWFGLRH
jgi:hypothetical protein